MVLGKRLLRLMMRSLSGSPSLYRLFIRSVSKFHMWAYSRTGGCLADRIGLSTARFIVLRTTGRKTGRPRTAPLLSITDQGNLVVVASYGGHDEPPAWWLNLQADPRAEVQLGRRTMQVQAVEADDEQSARLWPKFVAEYPGYIDYRNRTKRRIPIVILQEQGNGRV
jgi:deazaflavin-dependent oxidoreductase (nitroreductase family)